MRGHQLILVLRILMRPFYSTWTPFRLVTEEIDVTKSCAVHNQQITNVLRVSKMYYTCLYPCQAITSKETTGNYQLSRNARG